MDSCAFCNSRIRRSKSTTVIECTKCLFSSYCNAECKSKDAPLHALICQPFRSFISGSFRDSKYHHLALLLSSGEKSPRFTTILCRDSRTDTHCTPDFYKHPYLDFPTTSIYPISWILRQASPEIAGLVQKHNLMLYARTYDANTLLNQCVKGMVKKLTKDGKTEPEYKWCGSMIVLSLASEDPYGGQYQDFVPSDLRLVAEFFANFGPALPDGKRLELPTDPNAHGKLGLR